MSTGLATPQEAYDACISLQFPSPEGKEAPQQGLNPDERRLADETMTAEIAGDSYRGFTCNYPAIRPEACNAIAELMRVKAVWDSRR
ncbi:MAG: hypothetical protein PHE68_04375 [Candidatus Peribacteraceae bacterium]|nr:hypothetical protein [Candidatus Peribacteraceae bacterium]MDD5075069.1 hypothetical protein [Candidatus Peribacteraceae bacterium]